MVSFTISACVGGDVRIACDVITNPPPQWRINEETYDRYDMNLTQNHTIANIRQLQIKGVLPEHDGNMYQCINPGITPPPQGNNYTLSVYDQGK